MRDDLEVLLTYWRYQFIISGGFDLVGGDVGERDKDVCRLSYDVRPTTDESIAILSSNSQPHLATSWKKLIPKTHRCRMGGNIA